MTEEYKRLEERFRTVMGEATEPVPEGLWASVEAALPAAAPRKAPAPIFRLRRTLIGLTAAAAAVLLALTIPAHLSRSGDISVVPASGDRMTALKGEPVSYMPETCIPSAVPLGESFSSRPSHSSSLSGEEGRETAGILPSDDAETVSGDIPSITQDEIQATPETEASADQPSSARDSYNSDFWNSPEEGAISPRGVRTGIYAGGNALSNSGNFLSSRPVILRRSANYTTDSPIKEAQEGSYSIPLSFGAGVRISFSHSLALTTGVDVTLLNRKFKGTCAGSEQSTIRNTQYYIGIPLNLQYIIYTGDWVSFYVYGGGEIERGVSNKYYLKESDLVFRDKFKGLQYSVDAGAGVEFRLVDRLSLYVDPSVNYYFPGGQPKSYRTKHPLSFGFELGLRVNVN